MTSVYSSLIISTLPSLLHNVVSYSSCHAYFIQQLQYFHFSVLLFLPQREKTRRENRKKVIPAVCQAVPILADRYVGSSFPNSEVFPTSQFTADLSCRSSLLLLDLNCRKVFWQCLDSHSTFMLCSIDTLSAVSNKHSQPPSSFCPFIYLLSSALIKLEASLVLVKRKKNPST